MAFTDKVVLLTGASAGIGEETAKHFAVLGAQLSITGRNIINLNKVAVECRKLGSPETYAISGDLTIENDVKRIVDSTIKRFQKINVLVNNAGIIENGSIESTSLQQFDKVINLNVRSIYHLTMLVVPHLKNTKGTIINVSGVGGNRAFSNLLAYCTSKAALEHFTKCIALELAQYQIRVNSVSPGLIDTNIPKLPTIEATKFKEYMDRCKTSQPLGRPGKMSEVAQAILFLASNQASYITGTTIPVDGGKQIVCPR